MKDFRIALIQCRPTPTGSTDDNLALMNERLAAASSNGARLVAFPETSLTGYVTDAADVRARCLALDSRPVTRALRLSKEHDPVLRFRSF